MRSTLLYMHKLISYFEMIVKKSLPLLSFCILSIPGFAQNSILVNFGSTACTASNDPSFSLIKNPLSTSPIVLANCNMKSQMPDYYSAFVAYNPKDNHLYIADIRTGTLSKIWKLDVGLPGSIACPATIPTAPTYTHNYVSNNFEFDNNGDLWSFSGYNGTTGQCQMDKFDVTTGAVISTRVLQFPVGNFPTTIFTGDLTILPNGRMFATLGGAPSQLYEILNYNSTTTQATAVYLKTLPLDCYGISFLNGRLEIAGSDLVANCYYFDYEIGTNTISEVRPFQNGQSPIDNTSISPSIGSTKQLTEAISVNSTTVDLTYEIFVRNMGNVVLNDVNVTDDLGLAFGAGNVSNVSISFVPGPNDAGLTLNPLYNGTSNVNMLLPLQNLVNQTATNTNYFFKIRLQCRVSNLQPATTYLNSAVAKATINNIIDKINILDSSNNGTPAVVDPNNDGNASGAGENIPTPFRMDVLPVRFVGISAKWQQKNSAMIEWQVATPIINGKQFEIQHSTDTRQWKTLHSINITIPSKIKYQFVHEQVNTSTNFYRIKQTDLNGAGTYSSIVQLRKDNGLQSKLMYPNPANGYVWIWIEKDNTKLMITDVLGKAFYKSNMSAGMQLISVTHLPAGNYWINMKHASINKYQKLSIIH